MLNEKIKNKSIKKHTKKTSIIPISLDGNIKKNHLAIDHVLRPLKTEPTSPQTKYPISTFYSHKPGCDWQSPCNLQFPQSMISSLFLHVSYLLIMVLAIKELVSFMGHAFPCT